MKQYREPVEMLAAVPTMEGAGVRLKRAFGYNEVPRFDPFLLLDDFSSDNPSDYVAGFPWHPHRGIETVTYMREGFVRHEDSIGNSGTIGGGDVQWMTAGSGIIHSEMPGPKEGALSGFQLWVNLPASQKMMPPRYQEFGSVSIPEVTSGGVTLRIISGKFGTEDGPVNNIVADPTYIDVSMKPGSEFEHETETDYTCFAYIYGGGCFFGTGTRDPVGPSRVVLFGRGKTVRVLPQGSGCRFLLISGKPLSEPISWRGPIVMNTEDELSLAFEQYGNGTFLDRG